MRRWIAVLALGAVVVACSEQATAPQPRTPAVSADFTNNLEGGGPYLARYQFGLWYQYWGNADNTVRAFHTTFPLSWVEPWASYGWDDAICGPPAMTKLDIQEISHWSLDHTDPAAVYIENGMADVWIVLVRRAPGAVGPCGGRPIIASGWGKLHYNDNNGTGQGRPQDAWSFRAEGSLTTPAGEKVQYNGHNTCQVNANRGNCKSFINY